MRVNDEQFDIRKHVVHGGRTNELVDVVYNNINRMARLLDGLTLGSSSADRGKGSCLA